MAALLAPADDMEMEKIAEDELSKLQRQFRVMEIDRATVLSSVQPTLRMQKNIINTLNQDLEKIMMELKFTKSTSNLMEGARSREKLIALLKDHEKYSTEVKDHRETIKELDFLLKQVQKEIKSLRAKVTGFEIAYANVLTGQTLISQLENRLDTAMKKFNTVNSENYSMRLEIDRLLRDRQFFNTLWKNQLKRLMDGKAMIIELLEQAISTYDQREEWCSKLDALKEKAAVDYRKHCLREEWCSKLDALKEKAAVDYRKHCLAISTYDQREEWCSKLDALKEKAAVDYRKHCLAISTYDQREEWCSKLDALKEKAAVDYRKHCLEVRELQRQLDHSLKLEEFLRTKGTVRLTAADAKAEAKKLEQQEEEMRIYNNYVNILDAIKGAVRLTAAEAKKLKQQEEEMRIYNNYVNILDAIKEFAGEEDVDKLIQEFTRREEENYALFNYINEVCTELKNLSDNVKLLQDFTRREEDYALFNYINEVCTELKNLSDNVKLLQVNLEEENAKHQAKLLQQQDSVESLRSSLEEKRKATASARATYDRSSQVLATLLQQIHSLALSSDCDSLPLLKLLGRRFDINVINARLYIKSLEKKVLEIIDVIKLDELIQRQLESKERTPPSTRRRRARAAASQRPRESIPVQ
ncbi:hypothetical protein PYW07_008732 [Mythimna separata]|uniref:ODAD1 central coiled coil region domain-containing protein n=1 Tax=Mythimna separata TaxID=271217 RepID=A0AAD7YDA7_MYTSE|nr:hypothetical protein PYW07_008732 [Mythimna separata]